MPYSTPPATRIAYDLDGTVALIRRKDGSWYELTERQKKYYNDERTGGIQIPYSWYGGEIVLLFPTPFQLTGVLALIGTYYYASGDRYYRQRMNVFVSKDTTNGEDGTWEEVISGTQVWDSWTSPPGAGTSEYLFAIDISNSSESSGNSRMVSQTLSACYRVPYPEHIFGYSELSLTSKLRNIVGVKVTDVSIRDTLYNPLGAQLQIYGAPDTLSLEDRLDFWMPATDSRVSADYMGWADISLSSERTKSFRVKNMSSTKTVQDVLVSAAPLPIKIVAPEPSSFFLFSTDGITWEPQITFSSLSPGTVSPEIFFKCVVPGDALLSTWSPRVSLQAGSWM